MALDPFAVLAEAAQRVRADWRGYLRTQGLLVVAGGLAGAVAVPLLLLAAIPRIEGLAIGAEDARAGVRAVGLALLPAAAAGFAAWLVTVAGTFFGLALTALRSAEPRGWRGAWARFGPRFPAVFGAAVVGAAVPGAQ